MRIYRTHSVYRAVFTAYRPYRCVTSLDRRGRRFQTPQSGVLPLVALTPKGVRYLDVPSSTYVSTPSVSSARLFSSPLKIFRERILYVCLRFPLKNSARELIYV